MIHSTRIKRKSKEMSVSAVEFLPSLLGFVIVNQTICIAPVLNLNITLPCRKRNLQTKNAFSDSITSSAKHRVYKCNNGSCSH